MEQFQQLFKQSQRDLKRKIQGSDKPFEGMITSVNPQNEVLLSTYHGGERPLKFVQPFENYSSWIRATPDTGLGVLQTYTSDTETVIPLQYFTPDLENNRTKAFGRRNNAYRPLSSGEIEINSKGFSQAYFSRRPLLELRGGMIRSWHDQDQLEFGAKAPVIRFKLHQHQSNLIGDELRFGIVKRPENPSSLSGSGKSSLVSQFPKLNGEDKNWAKEYLFKLKTLKGNPEFLFDVREGHVYDDNAKPVRSAITSLPLRYDRKYFTKVDTEFREQLDELGNLIETFPNEAVTGLHTTIPKGNRFLFVGVNEERVIKGIRTTNITLDENLFVERDRTLEITGEDSTTVQGDQDLTVQGNQDITLQKDSTRIVNGNQSTTIDGSGVYSFGKDIRLTISDTLQLDVTGKFSLTVDSTGVNLTSQLPLKINAPSIDIG